MSGTDKVQAGQPMRIAAGTWNDILDMLAWFRQRFTRGGSAGGDPMHQTGIVDIKNLSVADCSRFHVLGIDAVFPLPSDNAGGFKTRRHLHGGEPASDHKHRLAVLLDAIPAGAIGKAVVAGVVPVQIAVADTTATAWTQADYTDGDSTKLSAKPYGSATILWIESGTGTKWALVSLGAPGGVTSLWVTLSANLSKDGSATATGTYRGVSVSLTVYDQLLATGQTLTSGSKVRVRWNHEEDQWDVVNAAC